MRRAALLIAIFALTACGDLFEPAAAVVNGDKIPVSNVQDALEEYENTRVFKSLSAQGDAGALRRQFEQIFLSRLIRVKVLEPEAEGLGLEVTEADVADRLDQIEAEFPSEDRDLPTGRAAGPPGGAKSPSGPGRQGGHLPGPPLSLTGARNH